MHLFIYLYQTLTKNSNHDFRCIFRQTITQKSHAIQAPRAHLQPSLGGSQRGRSMQPPHKSFSKVEFCSYFHHLLDVLDQVFIIVQALTLSEPGVGRAEDQVALRLYSRAARVTLP